MTVVLGCYSLHTLENALALRIHLLIVVGVSFLHPVLVCLGFFFEFFFFLGGGDCAFDLFWVWFGYFLIRSMGNFVFWLTSD